MTKSTSNFNEIDDFLLQVEKEMATVTIPWNYRAEKVPIVEWCTFATRPVFWNRVQWALKFAIVGCLPCAALILTNASKAFADPGQLLSMCVLGSQPLLGTSVANLIDLIKGMLIPMAILSIMLGANVAYHWALWGAMYALSVFLVAFFTAGGVTKTALLLITIGMVVHYKHAEGSLGWVYGLALVRDGLVGTAFGFASSWFPYARWNFTETESALHDAVLEATICIEGLADSLFCTSDVQRQSNLLKVRYKRQALGSKIANIRNSAAMAWFEPFVGERLNHIESRLPLLQNMAQGIDTLVEVVQYVHALPALYTPGLSEATDRFRESFGETFQELAGTIRDALVHIESFPKNDPLQQRLTTELTDYHQKFLDSLNASHDTEPEMIDSIAEEIRRRSSSAGEIGETRPGAAGERPFQMHRALPDNAECLAAAAEADVRAFPRIQVAFFAFNLGNLVQSILDFQEPPSWTIGRRVTLMVDAVKRTLQGTVAQVKGLFGGVDQVKEALIDAVKMSFAMTTTVAVLFLINSPDPIFSGPAVIAFVSGNDAGQTLRGSATQLFGTVFGSVFGFILASLSDNPFSLGGSIVGFALVAGFLRGSLAYGWIAFYALFAAFGAIRPGNDAKSSLTSIQQNVGAIVWYFILNSLIMPTRPSVRLLRTMHSGFASIKAGIGGMQHLMNSASTRMRENVKGVLAVADELPGLCAEQSSLLDSAAVEITLGDKDYPTHLVARVIQQQLSIYAVLSSLGQARTVLWRSPSAHRNLVLVGIAPWIALLISKGMQLMDRLMATLDGALADEDRLLVATCLDLDKLAAELSKAEREATQELIQKLKTGEVEPDSDPRVPAAVLTTVHCLSGLHHALNELFHAVSEMQHGLKELS
jgi:hypothetical protein